MVEARLRVSKSFVINADSVKAYDVAQDFFMKIGYDEQNAIRPTLLVLKKRRIFKDSDSSKNRDLRIRLRVSFNPVGTLQLYSTALVTIRCDYDIKISGDRTTSNDGKIFESEVESLKNHIIKSLHASNISQSKMLLNTTNIGELKTTVKEGLVSADVQALIVQQESEIQVGEDVTFEIQIENVGRKVVSLRKIENLIPIGFQLVSKPETSSLVDRHLIIKENHLAPGEKLEIKIGFKPFSKGIFEIKPRIVIFDGDKNERVIKPDSKTYNVSEKVLPGRISTGYEELDSMMFGGIPESYAVLMTSSSNDERELIIKKFLKTGAEEGQITFYVTAEPGNGKTLAEKFQSNFYLFVCNPRADLLIDSLPNVFKLSGVDNLNEIEIALAKSFRILDASQSGPRRACLEIVSDILLQHHAVITRKWLSRLLPELKSKGFTTLAVVNPFMHAKEEVQAILGLFDGEIKIYEKETKQGLRRYLRIEKLYNQQYLKNELDIERKNLES
jgi:KaiC/GvpD/RAD55 family RecA-like ATPase